MVLQCPKCKKQYNVDGAKITEHGAKITCPACSHQFIVRKRPDEGAPEKTGSKKSKSKGKDQRKTPPCAVCGEPSTHVFRGPPPKPLCEKHFNVEKERTSRFTEIPVDPGATVVVDPIEPPSPSPDSPPADQAQPAAKNFDDDFDFDIPMGDDSEPQVSAPQAAAPEPSPSEKPAEDKAVEEPPAEEPEESLLASPHEFLEPGGGVNEANASDSPSEPAPAEPEIKDDDFDFGDSPAAEGHEQSSVDRMLFSDNETLAGETIKNSEEEPESSADNPMGQEEGFDFAAGENAAPPKAPVDEFQADLDSDLEDTDEPAPKPAAGPAVRPLTIKAGSVRRKKSPVAALVMMAAVLIAAGAGAYLSSSGLLAQFAPPAIATTVEVPPWQGRFADPAGKDRPSPLAVTPVTPAPTPIAADTTPAPDRPAMDENARKVLALILEDTPAGFDRALRGIDAGLARDPGNLELLGLKLTTLAFRESLRSDGQIVFTSEQTEPALAAIDPSLLNDPHLLRVKAHSLINEKKTAPARTILEVYLDETPGDPIGLYLMGLTYARDTNPDLDRAASLLEQAVAREPAFTRAYWELAEIYRKQKLYNRALEVYSRIQQVSPDRRGVEEAIAETRREQAGETPGVLQFDQNQSQEVKPIAKTAPKIANNILEVIKETQPKLRRFKPPQKTTTSNAPIMPYERAPEAAPQ